MKKLTLSTLCLFGLIPLFSQHSTWLSSFVGYTASSPTATLIIEGSGEQIIQIERDQRTLHLGIGYFRQDQSGLWYSAFSLNEVRWSESDLDISVERPQQGTLEPLDGGDSREVILKLQYEQGIQLLLHLSSSSRSLRLLFGFMARPEAQYFSYAPQFTTGNPLERMEVTMNFGLVGRVRCPLSSRLSIEASFPFQLLRTSYERWDIDRSDLTTNEFVQKQWQLNTDPALSGTLGLVYRLGE